MLVKIHGGTRTSQDLCITCRNALVIKGAADSDCKTYCGAMENKTVPFRVSECNRYDNKAHTSIWDMREIAWVLSTDKQKKYGFKSPKDWKEQREELGIDELPSRPPGML